MMSAKTSVLNPSEALIVVVDLQDKLLKAICGAEEVVENCVKLVKAARVLGAEVICTTQYAEKLGGCTEKLAEVMGDASVFDKRTFSCMYKEDFAEAVKASGRRQVVLCGVETHVCVSQTAMHMLEAGYDVYVAGDAVSSRTPANKKAGLRRMRDAGCGTVSTEGAIFEMTRDSAAPIFKEILPIVK